MKAYLIKTIEKSNKIKIKAFKKAYKRAIPLNNDQENENNHNPP